MERMKNIRENSLIGIILQILLILIGFISQRILNMTMGQALIGLNGTISNVIEIISVSELGFSTAVIFHLYSAVASGDEHAICSLIRIYRRFYYLIAGIILMIGLVMLPFIHLFLKENPFSLSFVRIVYCLWLIKTVLSYPLGYKRSILVADQKEYLSALFTFFAQAFMYVAITILIPLTKNYILVLSLSVAFEAIMGIVLYSIIDRRYPYLHKYRNELVDETLKSSLFSDVKNIFVSCLSSKLLICTDNLIISSFISIITTGIYANYCLITQSVTNIVLSLNRGIQPSIGNLFTEDDPKKKYLAFRQFQFLYFLIGAFVASSLLTLLTPFVGGLWLDKSFTLTDDVVFLCAINCAVQILGFPLACTIEVTGLFEKERNLSIATVLVNIGVSLALVKPLGVLGVLIGTLLTYVVQIVVRSRFVVGDYLQMSMSQIIPQLIVYAVLILSEAIICQKLCRHFFEEFSVPGFICSAIVCVFFPNLINLLLFFRTDRFRQFISLLKTAIGNE